VDATTETFVGVSVRGRLSEEEEHADMNIRTDSAPSAAALRRKLTTPPYR
jgi:hypothetical protein